MTQRLQGPAAPLRDLGHPAHLVVVECADVVLQRLLELLHDDVRLAILYGRPERDVGLDDIDKLVGEVVLGGVGAASHDNGRADVEGGDGHDGHAHPLGAGPGDVQSEGFDLVVSHLFAAERHGLSLPIGHGECRHLFRKETEHE